MFFSIAFFFLENVALQIGSPKTDKTLPQVLSIDEVNRMINSIDKDDPISLRNRAMMELLYGSGLRISELLNIKLKDIHMKERYLVIIGKGDKERMVPISEMSIIAIRKYLEKAYNNGKDIEAREKMLKASFYAGSAFTRAFVGYVHAIAHNLGGMYNTPHGLANAVILPYVLEWYGESVYKPLSKLADLIGLSKEGMSNEEKAKAYIAEIRRMNKAMNIPEKFDFIKEEDIPTLVKRALKEGNPGYPVPRIMKPEDCEQVIRSLMA